MTKKEANNILKRIYHQLKDADIKVILDRTLTCKGLLDPGCNETLIKLHPNKNEFIPTIIHECLHIIDDKLDHEKINAMEMELMMLWSDRQLKNFLGKVFNL